ncbi:hypothetical protein [Streptosporangium sp. KLBMP 9127]|nr:hypothetical protein [Streptosporangium sp. KLBMP 9127]
MIARRILAAAATLVMSAAIVAAAAGTANAYNFPFNGRCGASWYYDGPSQTKATFSHIDNGTYWYKITWGGQPPVPGDPLHQHNWAGCRK